MEENVIVFIFKRKKSQGDNGKIIYEYKFDRLLKGSKITHNCDTFFISDEDKTIPYMEDTYSLDEEEAFGFPFSLKENDKNIDKTLEKLNNEVDYLKKFIIYQSYDIKHDELKTLATIAEKEIYYILDPYGYEGIDSLKEQEELSDKLIEKYQFEDETEEIQEEEQEEYKNEIPFIAKNIYTDDIYNEVSKTVICQDEQIKTIATAISKNQRSNNPNLKSNILVCGPTGVGKTEIFRNITKIANIPMSIEDSTEYTAASYKGKDVTEMLYHLYINANGNLEEAQRGIILVDEIDKKVSSGDHDTYTTAVIHSLLKMMEGHTYMVPQGPHESEIPFDTSHVTFAFSGAFSGIEKYTEEKKHSIGFNAQKEITTDKSEKIYTNETLKKFGLLPEFIGRNDTIVVMNHLDIPQLTKIIKESNKSQLLLYKEFFNSNGIDFIYSDETINKIAMKAKELGIGARGIKTVVENSLKIANYYALSSSKYKTLEITEETIDNPEIFILK